MLFRSGIAAVVLGEVERGRPLDRLNQVVGEIEAVTAEQVRAYAATHWAPGQLRTVVVGEIAAGGPALKALDAQAQLLDAAAVDLDSPTLKR